MLGKHAIRGELRSLDQTFILHIDSGPLPVDMKPDVGDAVTFRRSGLLSHDDDARPFAGLRHSQLRRASRSHWLTWADLHFVRVMRSWNG